MIVLYLILCVGLLVLVLFPFLSNKISPVPYFPSNKKDLRLVLKALKLRNNQTIVDLGAGDGLVVFAAASEAQKQRLSTQFVAIETNPILVVILYIRRLLHPNRKNIRILKLDMFKFDYSSLLTLSPFPYPLTFYIYISPWLIPKLVARLKKKVKKCDIVSYYYPIPGLAAIKKAQGLHKIFIYKVAE